MLAVEPHPDNIDLMHRNAAGVTILQAAIAREIYRFVIANQTHLRNLAG